MATEKKFVGSVKVVSTQYGEIIKIGFKKEHLDILMAEINSGKEYANIDICDSQKGGKYAVLDTFVADPSKGNGGSKASTTKKEKDLPPIANQGQADDDDLPF